MTALCLAAENNCAEAVEVLLQHGANPTILNCDDLSCMDIALDNRHHDVCMVLAKSDKWVIKWKTIIYFMLHWVLRNVLDKYWFDDFAINEK